jgi:hypothetical protein
MSRKLIISASLKIELGGGVAREAEGSRAGVGAADEGEVGSSVGSRGWKGWKGVAVGVPLQEIRNERAVLSGSFRGGSVEMGAG